MEAEAREMKSPEKLGKFDFVLIGIGSDKKEMNTAHTVWPTFKSKLGEIQIRLGPRAVKFAMTHGISSI